MDNHPLYKFKYAFRCNPTEACMNFYPRFFYEEVEEHIEGGFRVPLQI